MTYADTLEYLFARLPMYSRIGAAAYKDNLDNIVALCDFLDNPQKKFRSIHIAGTNGKGSCSHMIAAVLQAAGYKVGLHTSPHLTDFRERIRINGVMVDESFVVSFTEQIRPEIDRIDPSFFELSVAMAFQYFSEQAVDIAVIETGLGGRLDSTNIIIPEVSVITNIGWDHMNLLGNTLPAIAGEKAGIIKQHIPVVIGETGKDTAAVFTQVAAERGSPIRFADRVREVMEYNWVGHRLVVQVAEAQRTDHLLISLDLPGLYQLKNILTVLATIDALREKGWTIEESKMIQGLAQVKHLTGLHGRWEVIGSHPGIVLDVAHNEMGIRKVLDQVELMAPHQLHLVLGFVNDKAIDALLALLPATANYYFTQAAIPRALDGALLRDMAAAKGLHGNSYRDVNEALKTARQRAGKDDLVIVCGSIFLVAEVAEIAGVHR